MAVRAGKDALAAPPLPEPVVPRQERVNDEVNDPSIAPFLVAGLQAAVRAGVGGARLAWARKCDAGLYGPGRRKHSHGERNARADIGLGDADVLLGPGDVVGHEALECAAES